MSIDYDDGNGDRTIEWLAWDDFSHCKNTNDIKQVNANYKDYIIDGKWRKYLSSLEDGSYLFSECDNLITFNSDLSSLETAEGMFYRSRSLTDFNSDLSLLYSGAHMFRECTNLKTFNSDLGLLTQGVQMFSECGNLITFNSDLSSLTDGSYMFENCRKLTSFSPELPSLTDGYSMFYECTALTAFNSDLSNLTTGDFMFGRCGNLESFNSDLSSLTNGHSMFYDCEHLNNFESNLSSLIYGNHMFHKCKLNKTAIINIANSIKDVNRVNGDASRIGYKEIYIGHADDVPASVLWECGNIMIEKGWTVYFNGNNYSRHDMTYSITASNGYIPNASEWQNEVYKKNNLIITEITKDGRMINND
ncbi:MAG: leucine-rich repeat protein [Paludibacteraceae bacterium]|nr:leucine-rich repeat protein [Paludibacteraceae bacterium]